MGYRPLGVRQRKKFAARQRKLAAGLPETLKAWSAPSKADFKSMIEAVNPCAGKPAGTPCMTWTNPDGTVVICRCDGNGGCVPPA